MWIVCLLPLAARGQWMADWTNGFNTCAAIRVAHLSNLIAAVDERCDATITGYTNGEPIRAVGPFRYSWQYFFTMWQTSGPIVYPCRTNMSCVNFDCKLVYDDIGQVKTAYSAAAWVPGDFFVELAEKLDELDAYYASDLALPWGWGDYLGGGDTNWYWYYNGFGLSFSQWMQVGITYRTGVEPSSKTSSFDSLHIGSNWAVGTVLAPQTSSVAGWIHGEYTTNSLTVVETCRTSFYVYGYTVQPVFTGIHSLAELYVDVHRRYTTAGETILVLKWATTTCFETFPFAAIPPDRWGTPVVRWIKGNSNTVVPETLVRWGGAGYSMRKIGDAYCYTSRSAYLEGELDMIVGSGWHHPQMLVPADDTNFWSSLPYLFADVELGEESINSGATGMLGSRIQFAITNNIGFYMGTPNVMTKTLLMEFYKRINLMTVTPRYGSWVNPCGTNNNYTYKLGTNDVVTTNSSGNPIHEASCHGVAEWANYPDCAAGWTVRAAYNTSTGWYSRWMYAGTPSCWSGSVDVTAYIYVRATANEWCWCDPPGTPGGVMPHESCTLYGNDTNQFAEGAYTYLGTMARTSGTWTDPFTVLSASTLSAPALTDANICRWTYYGAENLWHVWAEKKTECDSVLVLLDWDFVYHD